MPNFLHKRSNLTPCCNCSGHGQPGYRHSRSVLFDERPLLNTELTPSRASPYKKSVSMQWHDADSRASVLCGAGRSDGSSLSFIWTENMSLSILLVSFFFLSPVLLFLPCRTCVVARFVHMLPPHSHRSVRDNFIPQNILRTLPQANSLKYCLSHSIVPTRSECVLYVHTEYSNRIFSHVLNNF